MNFIHRKGRNCLDSERVNKLTYISMNTRILRRSNSEDPDDSPLNFSGLTEDEQVEIEDELMQEGGLSDIDGFEEDESWFLRKSSSAVFGHHDV